MESHKVARLALVCTIPRFKKNESSLRVATQRPVQESVRGAEVLWEPGELSADGEGHVEDHAWKEGKFMCWEQVGQAPLHEEWYNVLAWSPMVSECVGGLVI